MVSPKKKERAHNMRSVRLVNKAQLDEFVMKVLMEKEDEEAPAIVVPPQPQETRQPQDISLDQKVDKYLIQYERESIPQSQQFAAEAKVRLFVNFLFEQPEDDPAGAPGDDLAATPDLGGDLGGAPPAAAPKELEVPAPTLNVNMFANKFARLVSNFEALVDPHTILMNRAQAYVTQNYSESVAKEFMITLDLQYGLSPKLDKSDELPERPIAAGAAGDIGAGTATGGT